MKFIKTIFENEDGSKTEIIETDGNFDIMLQAITGVCNVQMDLLKMQKELATGILSQTVPQVPQGADGRAKPNQPYPQAKPVQPPVQQRPTPSAPKSAPRTVPQQKINDIDSFYNHYQNMIEEENTPGYEYNSTDFQ